MAELSFDETMILGAIGGNKINPYQQETWNGNPDFYRGLARIAKVMAERMGINLQCPHEQFELWEKENDIEVIKKRVKEVIESLDKKGLLFHIQ